MKKVLIVVLIVGFSFFVIVVQIICFVIEVFYLLFELMDVNNKIVGFDVDLVNVLCKEIDVFCIFINQVFDSLIFSLKFCCFDVVMVGMDIMLECEKQVLFIMLYYDNFVLFVGQQGKYISVD